MRTSLLFSGLLLASACSEPTLVSTDPAPVITILTPTEDASFEGDATIQLLAKVTDNSDLADVEVLWTAGGAGTLGTVFPDENGEVFLAINGTELGEGTWSITAEAVDGANQTGRDSVTIHVGEGLFNGDGAPNVVFTGPSAGEQFLRDDQVVFVATVTDGEQTPDTLLTSLSASTVGVFWEGAPSVTGSVSVPYDQLPVGTHSVTLSALDDDGNVGVATVSLEVLNDGRPYATILAPSSGGIQMLGDTMLFEGEVADDEDDVELLTFEWFTDQDPTALNSGVADSNGWTAFGIDTLAAGVHLISFNVTDTDGKWASDSIILEVQDPADLDQDGDGYSPNDGDCNDNEVLINPGEYDACDSLDNNCDGVVNEPWADTYELNDTFDTHSFLGTIDADLGPFFADSLNVAGLTLQHAQDEDWFYFDLDDELWDSASPTVFIDVSAVGNYVIELYRVGSNQSDYTNWSNWDLRESRSGTGLFSVADNGELFDDSDDFWAVRVYSTSWTAGGCSDTYDLLINKK
ncbi:MAG: hypothetical protein GWP91_18855 [Rhodobacterales bacterium]|nr:hypothetical protein [Rhodobacterales bacterium]